MTSKELKRMNRVELLQMLLTLVEENEKLKAELNQALKQLHDKNTRCKRVGSIAEAALHMNDVFENADMAAKQYLKHIKELSDKQNSLYERMEMEAKKKAMSIVAEANAYKEARIREADEYWNYIRMNVRNQVNVQNSDPIPPKNKSR